MPNKHLITLFRISCLTEKHQVIKIPFFSKLMIAV